MQHTTKDKMIRGFENKEFFTPDGSPLDITCEECGARFQIGSGSWRKSGNRWVHNCSRKEVRK